MMLADRVARKLLSVTSSISPLFMRVKSMCIPRHIFFSSSVNVFNCSRYPSRRARGSVSSSPICSRPLNSVTSSKGNSTSVGSRIWNTIDSCFL